MTDDVAQTYTNALVQREIASLEKLIHQRIDSVEKAVTVAHDNLVRIPTEVDKAVGHLRGLMDERDLRYDQRFKAQTEAVSTAMVAAEKAVAAALSAADRAVLKAEGSTEKRFEAVNEFRASLNDMMTRLIPRAEADQRFAAVVEKIDVMQRLLDKAEGMGSGQKDAATDKRQTNTLVLQAVGITIALVVGLFGGGLLNNHSKTEVVYAPSPEAVIIKPTPTPTPTN